MKLLIGSALLLVGFIWGVNYDQNMAVLPLQRALAAERVRNTILTDALDHTRTNKFKIRDYVYDAMKRWEAAQQGEVRRAGVGVPFVP